MVFRTVVLIQIPVKNMGHMCKHSIVEWGVRDHVAREESNTTAIDPVIHPNNRHRCLVTEADHNVLPQHAPRMVVLLAQSALAVHLCPHNLLENAGRMKKILRNHHLSWRHHLRRRRRHHRRNGRRRRCSNWNGHGWNRRNGRGRCSKRGSGRNDGGAYSP